MFSLYDKIIDLAAELNRLERRGDAGTCEYNTVHKQYEEAEEAFDEAVRKSVDNKGGF